MLQHPPTLQIPIVEAIHVSAIHHYIPEGPSVIIVCPLAVPHAISD